MDMNFNQPLRTTMNGSTLKEEESVPVAVDQQEGPHPLEAVLHDVLHQVRKGKGERHGGDTIPFWEQTWAIVANDHGPGFLTGQAQKKLMEAVQSTVSSNTEPFERELMGAIAYLGMAILHVRKYGR